MKIPRDPADDYTPQQVRARLDWLAERFGRDFPYLGGRPYAPDEVTGTIENYVGTVGVPVGLAGPLRIEGPRARGEFVIPLATSEGALVASFSRGMRLITEAGGASVVAPDNAAGGAADGAADVDPDSPYRFFGDALTKISAVLLHSAADAGAFDAWLRRNAGALRAAADATSRHARLLEVRPIFQGDVVGLAFTYETGRAMGLNMATKANEAACRYIVEHAGDLVSGYLNTLGGDKRFVPDQAKGRYVSASVQVPEALVRERLRSTPDRMRRFLIASNTILGQRGMTAPNIHVANALAALFIACGQDPAFVTVTFKNACTTFEVLGNGDLLATTTLPNVIVGTIGGGSKLPAQRECLEILGCGEDARKLAEIAAAVALAGEVSVAGAVSAGEFTRAHTQLGRGVTGAPATAETVPAGGGR